MLEVDLLQVKEKNRGRDVPLGGASVWGLLGKKGRRVTR